MMYLGSNIKLRERKEQFISVEPLNSNQVGVRECLPEPNVYFIGSNSECSCGFPSVIAESPVEYYDGLFDDPDSERDDDLASVRELLTILDESLESTDSCTLFPVWNGSEWSIQRVTSNGAENRYFLRHLSLLNSFDTK